MAVADGSVVGMVSEHTFPDLPWRRHVGAIDIVVRAGWQGKGLGKALMHARLDLADARLDPTRLELEVYTDNEAAVRLYERLGFELEGTL